VILGLILRALLIAFLAGVAAWLPLVLIFYEWVEDEALTLLPVALFGSFVIGLPIALLVYYLAKDALKRSPSAVFMLANLAGVMMILTSYFLTNRAGMLLFGVPSWIAANVYAVLGWFWILKPGRAANENEGELGQ
jgi:hypothetical protein